MKRLLGLLLLLSLLRGGARRVQQRKNKLASGLDVSAEARAVLIPGVLPTGFRHLAGPRAGASREGWTPDGRRAAHQPPHRAASRLGFGTHRAKVALQVSGGPEENQRGAQGGGAPPPALKACGAVPCTRRAFWTLPATAAVAGTLLAGPASAEDAAATASDVAELQEKLARLQAEAAAAEAKPAVEAAPALEDAAAAPAAGEATTAVEEAAAVPSPVPAPLVASAAPSGPTAFDFDVPFRGEPRDIEPFLGKASLFINVKTTDPITIQQMPAITDLHDKYAPQGLSVLGFPTDQGWFEEDESDTLRLKLKQTFDFGKYPSAVVFDKADLLGENALPLYNYVTNALPNPWGVPRIVLNYEKILLDGAGRPIRRYPRKYPVNFMQPDIEAALKGLPLPPPSEQLNKAWEDAKREAIKSEYAFKFGLNYYAKGSPAS